MVLLIKKIRMRFYFILICFLLLFSPVTTSAASFSFSNEITDKIAPLKSLNQIEEKRSLLQEKENFLEIEQNKTFIEQDELKEMEALFIYLVEEIKSMAVIENEDEKKKKIEIILLSLRQLQSLIDIPAEYLTDGEQGLKNWRTIASLYESQKTEKTNILNNKTQEQKNKISITKEEIQNLKTELNLLEDQYAANLTKAFLRILVFIGVFLFLFILRSIISRMIEHVGEKYDFPEKKILALQSLKKWTFNITYFFIILIFFSVQILSILPFLAILGTALGFALRDVISSFIAWFVVGMKEGYKEGDVIKVGEELFGRVTHISPLITMVQELGMSGATGKYITFPNKKIFEAKISNWFKLKGYIFISIDFYLTQESNLEKAREIFLEILETTFKENYHFISRDLNFFKKMGFKEDDLKPSINLDIRKQGVFIRGKIFLNSEDQNKIRTKVSQLFIEKIQKEKEIKLLFSDNK